MLSKDHSCTQDTRGVLFKLLNFIFPPKLLNYLSLDQADVHLTELLKGSSSAFIIRMLGIGTGYVLTLLITRNYGSEAMGIFALAQTVLLFSSMAARLGLDTASLRFIAEYSTNDRWGMVKDVYLKSLKLLVLTGAGLTLLLYFLSPFMAAYLFSKPNLSPAFKIMSLTMLPFMLLFFHSESLRGLKKITAYAFFRNMSVPLVASVVLLIMIYYSKNIMMPVIAYAIGIAFLSILSVIKWLKSVNIIGLKVENSLSYKDMLSISTSMLLASSMLHILHWSNIFMLGIFRTESEVGIFNVAFKISFLTGIALFAINSIAAPKFAAFYGAGNLKGLGRLVQQSTKIIFWTSFPLLLVYLIFPGTILGIFGTEFRGGSHSLMILTLGQFVNAISGSVAFVLMMTGRQKIFQNLMIVSVILNILVNISLIPRFGINGAAFACMLSTVFWNLGSVYYIKRDLKILTLYFPFLTRKRVYQ